MLERFEVRPAIDADLEALNEVYNHYVGDSHVTFDIDPIPMTARREWFTHYGTSGPHRLLVAATANRLLGYASSSPYRDRPAYRPSVETSIYTAPRLGGHGIGSALYDALLSLLDAEDVHRAYGGIALPNPASIALHERCGFTLVGCFTEQGQKFDRYGRRLVRATGALNARLPWRAGRAFRRGGGPAEGLTATWWSLLNQGRRRSGPGGVPGLGFLMVLAGYEPSAGVARDLS